MSFSRYNCNEVVVVNNKGIGIQSYEGDITNGGSQNPVTIKQLEVWVAKVIVTFVVLGSDHTTVTLTFKIWLSLLLYMVYLVAKDLLTTSFSRNIESFPGKYDKPEINGYSVDIISRTESYIYDAVPMIECELLVTKVKIIEDDSDPDVVEFPEARLLFDLIVTTKSRR